MSEDPRSLSVNHSNFTSNGKPSQIKSIVGDVRLSMLTEAQFSDQVGQGWVLANGQDVTGSPYESITGDSTVPDMRGQFLRGKNNGRSDGSENPDGDLSLGQFQTEGYKSHSHSQQQYGTGGISPSSGTGSTTRDVTLYNFRDTNASGGNETRPNNITINYFIYIGF